MVGDNLCRKCQEIFTGHWTTRASSVLEIYEDAEHDDNSNPGVDEESSTTDFYDRPDWIQAISSQFSDPARSPKHHSITGLKESAADGCKLCVLLWDQLPDLLLDREQEHRIDLSRAIGIAVVRPSFIDTADDQTEELPRTLDLEITYCLDGRDDVEEAYLHLVIGLYLGLADGKFLWLLLTLFDPQLNLVRMPARYP